MKQIKRLWNESKTIRQVSYFVALGAFSVGVYVAQHQVQAETLIAHGKTLDDHESKINNIYTSQVRIEQKIDDTMLFLGVPKKAKQ